jgi:hypothetical protein
MNKIFTKICLYAAVALTAAVSFTACEDEPDRFRLADGTPTVYYVRPLKAEAADSLLTGAYLGNSICIVGDNLRSVYKLRFNDREAVLNNSYITDHTLLVDIPKTLPDEVTDKMYLENKQGEIVEFDFEVLVPAPSVVSMSCEYAPIGSEAVIYGDYFVDDAGLPLSVTIGKTECEIKSFTQGAINTVIPDGIAPNDPISVETVNGKTAAAFQWRDTRGLMFDFDGATGLGNHGWHNQVIEQDETSLTGKFLRLGDAGVTLSEDAGWNDTNFSFEYWCGSWDSPQNITSGEGIALYNLVDFKKFKNMSLKFEMNIPASNPWQAGAMQICFEGVDKVTLSGNPVDGYDKVTGANAWVFNGDNDMGGWARALYRPWTTTGSYDTADQWITVTVPISSFTYDREGKITDEVYSSYKDFASLTIFVLGGGINGTECNPIIKIDNIRAVPNE